MNAFPPIAVGAAECRLVQVWIGERTWQARSYQMRSCAGVILDERVPEIAHQKAAQQAAGADAATRRARSGLFWKLETNDRFPDLLVRRRSAA